MRRDHTLERWATVGGAILIGGGIFCALVVIYFFYHYTLTGQRQFTSPLAAFPYYYVPAALATLLFAALQFGRNGRINLAILCASSALSIYAAEVFLTLTDSASLAGRPLWGDDLRERKYEIQNLARRFGVDFDTRTKLEVVSELRRQGTDAVPAISPRSLLSKTEKGGLSSPFSVDGKELLPLGGISNRVTVFCNETGQYAIYRSDEHGLHNPSGLWRSGVSIAALGDSFTAGGCVSSDKGFVALIRNRYPATVNLAMAGEGPLMMLAALKEYGPSIRPKAVLWFYYEESDIKSLREERQSRLLMNYLGKEFRQDLVNLQPAIDRSLSAYVEKAMAQERAPETEDAHGGLAIAPTLARIAKLSALRQKSGLVLGTQSIEIPSAAEGDIAFFQSVLADAKISAAAWGGTVYFVYLPAWHRYGSAQSAPVTGIRHRQSVVASVESLGIPLIDIVAAFDAHPDPLSLFSFRRFGHYNEEGHGLVADAVLNFFSQSGRG
ncbi:MAG TPA: hypothetical protein VNL14_10685 [Candidatus Acidoferrales bacterium]|nr:hypothetical protein [Candidatus Acidoferrales bacterium]